MTDFFVDVLGFRVTEVVDDDGFHIATWLGSPTPATTSRWSPAQRRPASLRVGGGGLDGAARRGRRLRLPASG
jgi:hypothetical protein